MTVKELIVQLATLPGNASVFLLYDGELRREIQAVWMARSGMVGLGGSDEPVYDEEDRPEWAPTERVAPFWRLPPSRGGESVHEIIHISQRDIEEGIRAIWRFHLSHLWQFYTAVPNGTPDVFTFDRTKLLEGLEDKDGPHG